MVDEFKFYDWKSRVACLNCDDMRNSFGLSDKPEKISKIDKILDYLKYYTKKSPESN
ncbi:MAG: hypothetical protein LBS61_02775 [Endomicrobium sp.]|jgi:hypothetical protein|nr:hypothetical protein [Endomicrobium sp.]